MESTIKNVVNNVSNNVKNIANKIDKKKDDKQSELYESLINLEQSSNVNYMTDEEEIDYYRNNNGEQLIPHIKENQAERIALEKANQEYQEKQANGVDIVKEYLESQENEDNQNKEAQGEDKKPSEETDEMGEE